jgi:hypothetical protein
VTMSVVALGLLERAAKATALIIKLFCGPLSDYLGQRKGLLLMGYGLAAFAKPLLAELLLGTGRSVVSVFVGVALMLLLGGARLASGLTLTAGLLVAWARVFFRYPFPAGHDRRNCSGLCGLHVDRSVLAFRRRRRAMRDRGIRSNYREANRHGLVAPLTTAQRRHTRRSKDQCR